MKGCTTGPGDGVECSCCQSVIVQSSVMEWGPGDRVMGDKVFY